MTAAPASEEHAHVSAPPYTAFSSFKTALSVFKAVIVPDRVDRSVWGNKFSGSVVTQMIAAFRFLGLINAEGVPTARLRALVAAYGTEAWSGELRKMIEGAYAPLIKDDLEKVSSTQFNERFRQSYKAEGDTARKCMSFFLQAAREAGIALSPFLLAGSKPRAAFGAKRKPKPKKNGAAPTVEDASEEDEDDSTPDENITAMLLAKFPEFDPKWPDDIKEKWFAGFQEFMNRTKT
jgi:hypothetical protein